MKLPRRKFLHLAASAAALSALPRTACAQSYPTRPVHLLVGFPAGGASDIYARLTGQWLSERLGQPFVIENRPGAGNNTATELVARARPDGYTLLQVNATSAWNVALYDKLNFNFMRDIVPIASIAHSPGVLEVNTSVPVRTVPEFIAYAKANPGKITLAGVGLGSAPQLYAELFKMMVGLDLPLVQYRNSGPWPDLIAGRVQAMFDPLASSIGYIKAAQLRPLGVTTATRIEVLADIPPIADFVPGYEASGFQGLGAPANTPVEIIAPAEFAKFIAAETEKWGKVILLHRI
jgi:tripartite-type tricarboxylate transporter receptor subunit TctC